MFEILAAIGIFYGLKVVLDNIQDVKLIEEMERKKMIIDAKILKGGVPKCPECKTYFRGIKDYGIWAKGYWFVFRCENCSSKNKKIDVRYYTDQDFNVIKPPKKGAVKK